MTTEITTRYVDALEAASETMLESLREAGAERARFAERLLEETQTAQRRTLGLVRRFAENPADYAGNFTALIDATAQAQTQALDLTRAWFETVAAVRPEARVRFEKITAANREALRSGFAAARDLYAANPLSQAFRAPAAAAAS